MQESAFSNRELAISLHGPSPTPEKLSHLSVYNEIITHHDGGNQHKLPHMGKEKLEKQGALPRSLTVVSSAEEHIVQMHDPDYLSDIDFDESLSLDGSTTKLVGHHFQS